MTVVSATEITFKIHRHQNDSFQSIRLLKITLLKPKIERITCSKNWHCFEVYVNIWSYITFSFGALK